MILTQEEGCELLGTFGLFIQFLLGCACFLSLIIKRSREHPKRIWKIWILDNSKQVSSALTAHCMNIALSFVFVSIRKGSDQCSWYFVTLMFDTTVGVGISYIILRFLDRAFGRMKLRHLQSGNYFKEVPLIEASESDIESDIKSNPDTKVTIDYTMWFLQLLFWNIVVLLSKSVLFLIEALLVDPLDTASSFILGGLDSYANIKLVVVVIIVPCIMNSVQFWIQDTFLKKTDFGTDDRRIVSKYYEDGNISYLSQA
eukprot:TRINITY_DN1887_c0_g1_i7.p2 TRINITY_DN1887_c0_g1~~TRINITY_DN1887_c0_g1_i7.p2  ORF type:complete len:257 (-),score=20.39 TRINITY_DN1887_c0_g1_i7:908-1678(-)